MGTLKLQSNGPLYINTVIGTLAVTVGCYIWYSEEGPGRAAEGTGRGRSPLRPVLVVPNVTAHPSTARKPNFMSFNVALQLYLNSKGLKTNTHCLGSGWEMVGILRMFVSCLSLLVKVSKFGALPTFEGYATCMATFHVTPSVTSLLQVRVLISN